MIRLGNWVKCNVAFRENRFKYVLDKIDAGTIEWLENSGDLLKGTIAINTVVDTGKTAGSWEYDVAKESSNRAVCRVYSNEDNAVFEEFGTGKYIEKGKPHTPGYHQDGKNYWFYKNEFGETKIGVPKRARKPATQALKTCIPIIESMAKEHILK